MIEDFKNRSLVKVMRVNLLALIVCNMLLALGAIKDRPSLLNNNKNGRGSLRLA